MNHTLTYHCKLISLKQRGSYKAISELDNAEAKNIKALVDQVIEGDFEKFGELKTYLSEWDKLCLAIDDVKKFNEKFPHNSLGSFYYIKQLDYICLCILEVMLGYLMKHNRRKE